MEGEEVLGVDIQEEKLSGFIFMCNRITKPECYRYRVFGLPAGRKDVVEMINPGTYLFLFDTDVKLLYGIYMATSAGKLNIEPLAFGQKYPAQVQFKIYKDCLPLPVNCFKHAIQDNYQKGSNKFNPELNIRQVRSLIELFRPLHELPTAPGHPFLQKPLNIVYHQISEPPVSEGAFLSRMSPNQAPRLLNYKHVNELRKPTGCAYPVHNVMPYSAAAQPVPSQVSTNQLYYPASTLALEGTYAPGIGSSHTQPLPDPQYSHQTILNSQPEFHSSMMNSGHAQQLQESQDAHHNIIHPQSEFHSSLMTMGSSHTQSLQSPQYPYQSVPNPSHEFYTPVANAGSCHPQLSQGTHYTHPNILNLQPDAYSTMVNTGSGYAQLLPDPQHRHQNAQNPQPDFNSSLVNMGHASVTMQSRAVSSLYHPYVPQEVVSSMYSPQWSGATQGVISSGQQTGMGSSGNAQLLPDPQHRHQNAQNPQPDFNSSLVNMGHANVTMQSRAVSSLYHPYVPQEVVSSMYSSQWSGATQGVISSDQQTGMGSSGYAQLLPDPQHRHQNAQNPQPDFNSSLMNMGHANVTMQSRAVSSLYHPYVPQVVSSMYSSQWSGATQGVISSGQQTGMGSEYYQSSMQTDLNSAKSNS